MGDTSMAWRASTRHKELEKLLVYGRLEDSLTNEQEKDYCDEMSELWKEMNDIERQESGIRMAFFQSAFPDGG